MANINISNLSGSDLCNDSDSYLIDITDDTENILGGGLKEVITTVGTAIKSVLNVLFPPSEMVLTVGEPTITPMPKK
jgi:hypothetical protein